MTNQELICLNMKPVWPKPNSNQAFCNLSGLISTIEINRKKIKGHRLKKWNKREKLETTLTINNNLGVPLKINFTTIEKT